MNSNLKKSITLLITLSMMLTLIPFLSIQTANADTTISITNSLSATNIQDTIQNAITNTSPGNTLTITGNKNNENAIITLNIHTGITVVWKATSNDLSFNIDGGGIFEVAEDGKIAATDKNAIEAENGNVLVSGGEVSVIANRYSIAIFVKNGTVTVSGGKVSAVGNAPSAIEVNTGNITISAGEISVDTTGYYSYSSYAVSINTSGTIVVTGGSVSAISNPLFGELNENYAIYLSAGIVAYLQGVCNGKFDSSGKGIIVEVASLSIPSSYAGTNSGLTHKDGGDINNVKWDFSGVNPAISFNRMQYIAEWKVPVTEPQNPSTVNSVRLAETGALFDTLNEAMAAAKNLHYNTFTLEVIGNVAETSSVIIGSENIAIVGAEGAHTFAFTSPPPAVGFKFSVEGGGSLTLGDGTEDNVLTISHTVNVINGKITVKDGVILNGGLFMSGQAATGSISGGKFRGYIALELDRGATISEISGGVFTGEIDAVHLSDTDNKANIMGTKIELISGGHFYQRDNQTKLHGHAVFVQNYAEIGTISGGEFDPVLNCALVLIRGGKVGEISGGTFEANRVGSPSPPDTRNAAIRVDNGWADEAYDHTAFDQTGIGTISGGSIKGAFFGLVILADFAGGHSYVNSITGGTFEGTVAVQVDRNSAIDEITGGTITGSQGMLNTGTIGKISGNVQISGSGTYGIYNFYSNTQIYGQIDEISGNASITGRDYAIMNSGTITLISGGTFIGGSSAINCDGSFQGKLYTISNGVFWGRTSTTIRL